MIVDVVEDKVGDGCGGGCDAAATATGPATAVVDDDDEYGESFPPNPISLTAERFLGEESGAKAWAGPRYSTDIRISRNSNTAVSMNVIASRYVRSLTAIVHKRRWVRA